MIKLNCPKMVLGCWNIIIIFIATIIFWPTLLAIPHCPLGLVNLIWGVSVLFPYIDRKLSEGGDHILSFEPHCKQQEFGVYSTRLVWKLGIASTCYVGWPSFSSPKFMAETSNFSWEWKWPQNLSNAMFQDISIYIWTEAYLLSPLYSGKTGS